MRQLKRKCLLLKDLARLGSPRVITREGSFGRPRDLGIDGAPVVSVAPGGTARLTLWSDVRDDTQLLLWTRR